MGVAVDPSSSSTTPKTRGASSALRDSTPATREMSSKFRPITDGGTLTETSLMRTETSFTRKKPPSRSSSPVTAEVSAKHKHNSSVGSEASTRRKDGKHVAIKESSGLFAPAIPRRSVSVKFAQNRFASRTASRAFHGLDSSADRKPRNSKEQQRMSTASRGSQGDKKRPWTLQGMLKKWNEVRSIKFAALDATTPLGAYLTSPELMRLASACSMLRMAKDDLLPESPFYLVLEGAVNVVDVASGDVICTRKQWSFFSRQAGVGILDEKRAAASVELAPDVDTTVLVCQRPSKILFVTSEDRLETFYWNCSLEGQSGYDTIVNTNLATKLNDVPFIKAANVDNVSLRKLGELCSYLALQEGESIFEQGDVPDAFYIILKGGAHTAIPQLSIDTTGDGVFDAVAIDTVGDGHADTIISKELEDIAKGPGETFGVAALVLGEHARQYGMVATEKSVFLCISQENFEPFMKTHPGIEPSIMLMTKRFLLQRYAMIESSFFHAFTDDELERAAVHATLEKYTAGDVVYHLGDQPKAFYVIAHGEVSRDYLDGSPSRVIPMGAYFGEMGVLLPRTPNLATVMATADSTLLTISNDDWPKVVPPSTTTDQGRRAEGLMRIDAIGASKGPLGYDSPPELRSTHSAALNAAPRRDLHFTLQVNLLLRLQREDAPLDALLMHPEGQPQLLRFAERALRGAFRSETLIVALVLLQRVRIASKLSASSETAPETEKTMIVFLMEQMVLLISVLQRLPCPGAEEALGPEDVDDEDGVPAEMKDVSFIRRAHEGHVMGLDYRALRKSIVDTHALEARLMHEVKHETLRPADLEGALNRLCGEYLVMLQIAHSAFLVSRDFREVMDIVGPFDKDVAKRVDLDDVLEITDKVLAISPTAQIRKKGSSRPGTPLPPLAA